MQPCPPCNAAMASPIPCSTSVAGQYKSFPVASRNSIKRRRSERSGGPPRIRSAPIGAAFKAVNTRAVLSAGTGCSVLTRTTSSFAGGRVRGETSVPLPSIHALVPAKQTGTSAPSPAAIACQPTSVSGLPSRRRTSRRTAAASAEPPPRPAATGMHFSIVTAPASNDGYRLEIAANVVATMFSPWIAAANGPVTEMLGADVISIPIRSPTPANATRLRSA